MVLPVFSHHTYGPLAGGVPVGKQKRGGWLKSGRGKTGALGQHSGQPMTVNLVVDPTALARLAAGSSHPSSRYDDAEKRKKSGRDHHDREEEEEEEDSSDAVFDPNDHDGEDTDFAIPSSSSKRRRGAAGPLGVIDAMQVMRLQDRWRAGRKSMKRQAFQDGGLTIVWLAIEIWLIGFGDRCPPGTSAGW